MNELISVYLKKKKKKKYQLPFSSTSKHQTLCPSYFSLFQSIVLEFFGLAVSNEGISYFLLDNPRIIEFCSSQDYIKIYHMAKSAEQMLLECKEVWCL